MLQDVGMIEGRSEMKKVRRIVVSDRGSRSRSKGSRTEVHGTKIDFKEAVKNGTFEGYVQMMRDGLVPFDKMQVTDIEGNGLRALVRRDSGSVSYHCHFHVVGVDPNEAPDEDEEKVGGRPHFTLGHYPETSVEDARALAATIYGLGQMGIDIRSGMRQRLLRELKAKGMKWRLPKD